MWAQFGRQPGGLGKLRGPGPGPGQGRENRNHADVRLAVGRLVEDLSGGQVNPSLGWSSGLRGPRFGALGPGQHGSCGGCKWGSPGSWAVPWWALVPLLPPWLPGPQHPDF